MKRILYVLEDYPVVSESYVETEIEYFLRQGLEIAVWARRQDTARTPGTVPVIGGSLKAAAQAFKPSLVHVHWFPLVQNVLVENLGLPITVRSHSFEFNPRVAKGYATHPAIGAVFMFPHLIDITFRGGNPGKAIPLVAAYDDRLYYPEPKSRATVVRASAGLASKDLDMFLEVAKLFPEGKFTLIVSRPKEGSHYVDTLLGRNASLGSPVTMLVEISRTEAANVVRKSEICLRSNNPTGHPFGMPISIAEAMAAGTIPVVRDHAPARSYVGDAGLYFSSIQEAALRIRELIADPDLAGRLRTASIDRARRHASSVALPIVFETWERLCGW